MRRTDPSAWEGILIIFVGLIGLIRVFESFPNAGEMIKRMLYTLFFIFIAITLIGLKTLKDSLRKD